MHSDLEGRSLDKVKYFLIFLITSVVLVAGCDEVPKEDTKNEITGDAVQDTADESDKDDAVLGNNTGDNKQPNRFVPVESESSSRKNRLPECVSDADCKDDDGCTVDKCLFASHPNAFCSTEVITRPKHNDGCCPKGANLDTDIDCKPVCGNKRCEMGELESTCEIDCKYAGSAGSGGSSGGSGPTGGQEY